MDMAIGDLIRFNERLDSAIDPKSLDEDFIALRQDELDCISMSCDVKHIPFVALSYAKLMELTILLAGSYADNGQSMKIGDLVLNPRHIDVCILNTSLIKEDYGIDEGVSNWFKQQVRERIGWQYSEDLGRMVVDPYLLSYFVEKGLLLRIVKKERHGRLSDQFRYCITDYSQFAFSKYVENSMSVKHNTIKSFDCGCGMGECRDVASWLSSSTVLNIVKDTLKSDLMNELCESMSEDYLKSIDKRFEKAFYSLNYVEIGRESFVDFPYNDEVPAAEWAEINNTLCHFTLDGYGVIQSELDKSLSNSCYESPFLNRFLYNAPERRGQMVTAVM